MTERRAIINNDAVSRMINGMNNGGFNIRLSDEEMRALLEHKCVAINVEGEYVLFLYNNCAIDKDIIDKIYPEET